MSIKKPIILSSLGLLVLLSISALVIWWLYLEAFSYRVLHVWTPSSDKYLSDGDFQSEIRLIERPKFLKDVDIKGYGVSHNAFIFQQRILPDGEWQEIFRETKGIWGVSDSKWVSDGFFFYSKDNMVRIDFIHRVALSKDHGRTWEIQYDFIKDSLFTLRVR